MMKLLQILPMAVLQILPLAVLEPLAGDAALGADAVLQIMPDDEALGAFGHGEPSCRSCRWQSWSLRRSSS